MPTNLNSEKLASLLESHRDFLKSPMQWEEYQAKKKDILPTVEEILSVYPDWISILKQFSIPRKKKYSEEELWTIANHYKDHMTSARKWDLFAQRYALPRSSTMINTLGKWSSIKEQLSLPHAVSVPSSVYSKEEVEQVLKEHGSQYGNPRDWDKYAQEHSLPTYKTIRNYLTYEDMKPFISSTRNFSKAELANIANQYREHFTTIKKWDQFAKENNLPNSVTYYRRFGSWRKAKGEILH